MAEDRSAAIAAACHALDRDNFNDARQVIRQSYPFLPTVKPARRISLSQRIALHIDDGFLDRYSGRRLVFPGALRLISLVIPDEFPYHPHGRMELSHPAWWDVFPSVDHVVPVARGGSDSRDNWVTTSMALNAAKGNASLEELGWVLHPPGRLEEWDGLTAWFRSFLHGHPDHVADPYIRRWYVALQAALDRSRCERPRTGQGKRPAVGLGLL